MTNYIEPWRRLGKRVRVVCEVPKKWDGFCPDCKRGADGFINGIWCDCDPPAKKSSK